MSTENLPNIFAPGIATTEEQTRGLSGIYRITSPTGRVYVGQAQCIATRWNSHRRGSTNRLLAASLEKHGTDAHKFEVVEIVADLARLTSREQAWIDALWFAGAAGLVKKMNLSPTAASTRGYKYTDEQRARKSAAAKKIQKEVQNRPEVKARKSVSTKEVMSRPDVKERVSAAIKQAQNRPEVKARNSAAQKASWSRPEVRARMSAAMSSPETKARMSAAQKEAHGRPEVKARMSTAARVSASLRLTNGGAIQNKVSVEGRGIFRSVRFAFDELGIHALGVGISVHLGFRAALKKGGQKTFVAPDGTEYVFKVLPGSANANVLSVTSNT